MFFKEFKWLVGPPRTVKLKRTVPHVFMRTQRQMLAHTPLQKGLGQPSHVNISGSTRTQVRRVSFASFYQSIQNGTAQPWTICGLKWPGPWGVCIWNPQHLGERLHFKQRLCYQPPALAVWNMYVAQFWITPPLKAAFPFIFQMRICIISRRAFQFYLLLFPRLQI